MIDDACMKDFVHLIKSNVKIKYVSFGSSSGYGNHISDKGIQELSLSLEGNTSLLTISFSFNPLLSEKSISSLQRFVRQTKVEDLQLKGTDKSIRNCVIKEISVNKLKNPNNLGFLDLSSRYVFILH